MEPRAVRAAGATIGGLAREARAAADGLAGVTVPTGAAVSIEVEARALLRVWEDGVRALATELRLLDDRCLGSAASVSDLDAAAQQRFSRWQDHHDPAVRGRVVA